MHYPVMLQNVLKTIASLNIHRKITLADCNFGLGGHSNAILKQFPNCSISGFDLDAEILLKYKETVQLQTGDQSRLSLINSNFTQMLKMGNKYDILLADLGFNSLQLEQNQGFSWNKDTKLDMRYSRSNVIDGQFTNADTNKSVQTCQQLIKRLSFIQIVDILVKYGDLNTTQAKLAAKQIQNKKPKTTFQLRDCVVGCFQNGKTKKVAQVFQAMRVAVNGELESLKNLCQNMDTVLNKNALIMIITFHSLERDIVHRCIKQKQKLYSKIKTQHPSKQQIDENTRSKSAQMLVFKKL